ncbi:peptidase [Pedobacter yulinensis]|uniref:Peptidase n=1 Tax=Pedobacter yulinensis TaxID=2126353 RepID=A0A2T3HRI1_9SPHI|nr:M14 metallopeptidase family protein [Pedobacter yulinensis]PST85048.1 peptidase [Pedobacter yulinensis]
MNYCKILGLAFCMACVSLGTSAQVPSPKAHFGFDIGENYKLANYTQTEAYFKKLAAASDRVKLVSIGKTEEGRDQYMLIVSSPENLAKLETYKRISQQLARARITEVEAKKLTADGKAIVWIDGGLHANETVGIHQLIETAWQLCSRQDAETNAILDKVIVLMTHANPDGQELISNWYMRHADTAKRTISFAPRLYQKYVGHDNNRDFFMLNMKETQNIGRQLFVEWLPQIMYNHHQAGPAGTVVAGPPYRDPFNYVFDPVLMTSLDAVGAAMHNRMNTEGKPGYTQRNGSVFSTWYNGGLRTTTYFHNMIGLLTEIVGSPTPSAIPLVPARLLPNSDSPNPVTPRAWFFRNSIDYSVSLNYAVLGYAQRYRDDLLFNIYRMGRNSIERGSRDTWSFSPKKIEAIQAAVRAGDTGAAGVPARSPNKKFFDTVMTARANRDARGYIIPANQPDLNTAIKFLNALIRTGIEVEKATEAFRVGEKSYPAGSFIVKTDQAFRPHVLDMFEPQDHPNDFKYPGGPPVAPYDAAGWTLAYLMNVKFDRISDAFSGPFSRLPVGELIAPSHKPAKGKSLVLSGRQNDSFRAVNDLLQKGIEVRRDQQGNFHIPGNAAAVSVLSRANVKSAMAKASGRTTSLKPARIALWDTYGGSMASGWVRWLMEQFHYPATVIYPQDIDAGNLNAKFDVIVFVGGAIPPVQQPASRQPGPDPNDIPEAFRHMLGRITAEKSIPQLKRFLEEGGTVVTIGSSTNLAYHLGLPVKSAVNEVVNGRERKLPEEKYYIPGSVLQAETDQSAAAMYGMDKLTDVYFDDSPVFKRDSSVQSPHVVKPLMWFSSASPLRSGWAWGQASLTGAVAAFESQYGKGRFLAFGPEITFRAQTHGTFKLLFNQLYK